MSKNIQILKRSTVEVPNISSYKLVLEAVNAENMPDKIFVNQRVHNFAKGTIDDTFAAVCTPVQLEDFPEDAPEPGSSYFRTNVIELVVRTPEMLQTAFNSIIYEVKKLVLDLEDLDNLSQPVLYNVSPLVELTEIITLSVPEIESLTSTQLNALSKYEISALLPTQLQAFSTDQLAALTLPQVGALTALQVTALSTAQISALGAAQVAALTPSAVGALQATQLAAMSVTQIDALTTKQIGVLTASQVVALRTDALPTLTAAQIAALSHGAIAGLTTTEITALTTEQLTAMQPEDVAAISPAAIHNLRTDQVAAFTTEELAAFTPAQVLALTTSQLEGLTTEQVAAIPTPPVPPPAPVPTLWRAPNTVEGNVPEIVQLSDFASNFVRANIGNAASWTLVPYSFVDNGTTYYDGEGIMFTINNVTTATSKVVLSLIYKNNGADPERPGIDLNGNQWPYMYVRNLTGAINGNLTVRWNGQTVAYVPSGDMPSDYIFEYYPDDDDHFQAAGKLVPGQSTAMVIEIEAKGAATVITGELFFGYYL